MNTSKEYVLMCQKANEIQEPIFKQKEIYAFSYYYTESGNLFFFYTESHLITKEPENKCWYIQDGSQNRFPIPFTKLANENLFYKFQDGTLNFVWLPTQDQLQDIFIKNHKELGSDIDGVGSSIIDGLLYHFDNFIDYIDGRIYDDLFSMEQLWLAFVMKVEYNKIWNGKDWKKNIGNKT